MPPADRASFRVTWTESAGKRSHEVVVEAPRIEERCLALKVSQTRLLWVPLHTITGPIEVEAI